MAMQEQDHMHDEPSPFKYFIALSDEHSKHLNRICELEDEKRRKGQTYSVNLTLAASDLLSRIVYIDLVRGNNKNASKNLPVDAVADFPYTKVFQVIIKNKTGADIVYGINRGPNMVTLNNSLAASTEKTFDSLFPVFENISLARASTAGSNAAVVELVLLT